jgi:hypothetical protein
MTKRWRNGYRAIGLGGVALALGTALLPAALAPARGAAAEGRSGRGRPAAPGPSHGSGDKAQAGRAGGDAAGTGTAASEAARTAYLAAEVEAAASGDLYLVLRPAAGRLDVACRGMDLHTTPLDGARLVPAPGGGPPRWPALAFRLTGSLADIRRPEIEPPSPGAAPAPPVAPTPAGGVDFATRDREEKLGRAPAAYLLRFDPALELEVRPVPAGSADAGGRSLAARVAGGARAIARVAGRLTGRFTGSGDAPPRLVLELSEPEARRLYLTLEPEIRLLIDPAPSAPAG